jgi:diguanylate cyclase (GGDEF)-like protein/PAS domain S-box-containing protein
MSASVKGVARAALIAVAVAAIVATTGLRISQLRQRASEQRATAALVEHMRIDAVRAENVALQSLVENGPDFTLQSETAALSRRVGEQARRLAASGEDREAVARVGSLVPVFRTGLGEVQAALRARASRRAQRAFNDHVHSTSELLRTALDRAAQRATAAGDAADRNADTGAVVALAAALLLISGLAWGIGRIGRRARAVEREARERSNERVRALVYNASEVIAVVDTRGTVLEVTGAALHRVLGFDRDEIVGTSLADLLAPADHPRLRAALTRIATPGARPRITEWEVRHRDGHAVHLEAVGSNMLHVDSVGGLVLTLRDVSERRAMEQQLRHQAFHDGLTGLANRQLFEDRVRHALDRSRRSGAGVAVLFVDLDDFKTVNDSLGHAAGDRLLTEVARRVASALRAGDTAARLGGDEFAVLLEDAAGATEVAERVLAALSEPIAIEDRMLAIGASVGVAEAGPSRRDAEALLRGAGIRPCELTLELTESALAAGDAGRRLSALRDLGVQIAVDDFGTGYSSLGYLRRLEIDCVKIDRSFVAGVTERGQDAALVRSIVELAHALELEVVAEGIETPGQAEMLRKSGCGLGQGFLFATPQPAPSVSLRLDAARAAIMAA